jgi:uncharacterized protein
VTDPLLHVLSLNIPGGEWPAGPEGGRAPLPCAYIPGQTPRHPEGAFDALRATARAGMDEGALASSAAFRAGLHYLHTGYFWESHEVLEPVWMACPPNSPARQMAQALIQIANARLKDRMGRPRAASRLRAIAARHLAEAGQGPVLGLDPAEVELWLKKCNIVQNKA